MAKIREVTAVREWDELLESTVDKPLLLIKHSTRCPISARAYDEFLKHTVKAPAAGIEYALVHVVEQRAVSNAVAEALGVRHESPQAIIIKDKQVIWHDSHSRITEDTLREQTAKLG